MVAAIETGRTMNPLLGSVVCALVAVSAVAVQTGCDRECVLACDENSWDVTCGAVECNKTITWEQSLTEFDVIHYARKGTIQCPGDREYSFESDWIESPGWVEVDGVGRCTETLDPMVLPTIEWQVEHPGDQSNTTGVKWKGGSVYSGHGQTFSKRDPATGDLAWEVEMDAEVWSRPAQTLDAALFLDSSGLLRCVEDSTGAERWTYDIGGAGYADLAANGNAVYASTGARVVAVAVDTGEEYWAFEMDGPAGSRPFGGLVSMGGRVFAGGSDGVVYSLDANNGDELWRYETGAEINSTPLYWDGKIIIGNDDGDIYCLGESSGYKHWFHGAFGSRPSWRLRPVVDDETLFTDCNVLGEGTAVCALSVWDGDRDWTSLTDVDHGSPVYDGSNVHFGGADGIFRSFWSGSGEVQWEIELGPGLDQSAPAIYDDWAVVNTERYLYGMNLDI